jgi:uncharacterized protein
MNYCERTYRTQFSAERFKSFTVNWLETDLWIGVDHKSFNDSLPVFALTVIQKLRQEMDSFIRQFPLFHASLEPIEIQESMPHFAKVMAEASAKAGVGPMAAVAGYFASHLAEKLLSNFKIEELIIENGGDYFIKIRKKLAIAVFAGESTLSGKTGFSLEPGSYGVCTSAGKVGPSLSFGTTDATVVIADCPVIADAWATSLGNRVNSESELAQTIKFAEAIPEISSCIIIFENNIGFCGETIPFPLN